MSEESKRNLGISISSTNVPTIQMCEDKLQLSFLNWECQNIQIEFASTLAFRWNSLPCSDKLNDDVAFEVFNSEWLSEIIDEDSQSDKKTDYHHYQFCIYGCWLFEVIAEGLGMHKEESEVACDSWANCAF